LKKAVIAVLILINLINVTGCGFADFMEARIYDPHYSSAIDDEKYNEETLKEILECFDNKDSERLKAMFSKSVAATCDLDKEIESAFDMYNGKSVSYDSIFDYGPSGHTEYGRWVKKYTEAKMKKIKLDTGKTYSIYFCKEIVNDENPDEIGIRHINLKDKDSTGDECRIGEKSTTVVIPKFSEE